jgi:phospholipid transport system transporter-binding protein
MADSARLISKGTGFWELSGALTFDTVPSLVGEGKKVVDGAHVVVDLKGVTQSDSAGLALLIEWTVLASKQNLKICYIHVPAQIKSIASVSGLDDVLSLDKREPEHG